MFQVMYDISGDAARPRWIPLTGPGTPTPFATRAEAEAWCDDRAATGGRPRDLYRVEEVPAAPESTPEPPTYAYSVLGTYGGRLATLRTIWATDDDHARRKVGELASGTVLVRDVERASPGTGGVL